MGDDSCEEVEFEPQMHTDGHRFLYKEETHAIIGFAMEVLHTLGHGLLEKSYENALCVEISVRQVAYIQETQ